MDHVITMNVRFRFGRECHQCNHRCCRRRHRRRCRIIRTVNCHPISRAATQNRKDSLNNLIGCASCLLQIRNAVASSFWFGCIDRSLCWREHWTGDQWTVNTSWTRVEHRRHESINIRLSIELVTRDAFYEERRANRTVWKFSARNCLGDGSIGMWFSLVRSMASVIGNFTRQLVNVWTTRSIFNNVVSVVCHWMWEPIETN